MNKEVLLEPMKYSAVICESFARGIYSPLELRSEHKKKLHQLFPNISILSSKSISCVFVQRSVSVYLSHL